MAKYDFGGGCPCGLYKVCECGDFDENNNQIIKPKINLFQLGNFKSHAGLDLEWKIECDALTDEDWECLAKMIAERTQFGSVYGIPRGGTKLANALQKYVTPKCPIRLVVDDVWTTGKSMMEVMQPGDFGFVVFARQRIIFDSNKYVRALFTMDML